ncbi:hypothetical protein BKA56DRAFT_80787 [Ilyonectria sp. MPI-CAGE-AT-0026]|nr:hypothetical protein BKA56DRAFT_80787 [Ilyonectria sp. MPI-CAGE-AT-0026]
MIAIILVYYLVFFDPSVDPFADASHRPTLFKPNPIDTMLLGSIRRLWTRWLLGTNESLRLGITKCILGFVDLQLIAGLGILISGFLSLNGLSAYHWSIIVYLAWLSNIAHLSGLTLLRGYFHCRPWDRNWRVALMSAVLGLLLAAMTPTGFFNWNSPDRPRWVPKRNAPVACFFPPGRGMKSLYEACMGQSRECVGDTSVSSLSKTAAFQSMVFSMVLLVCNFSSRVLRAFRPVSKGVHEKVRQKISNLAKHAINSLSTCRPSRLQMLNQRQWHLMLVEPWLAFFLLIRLYVDIYTSMLSEIYWLLITSLWATARLFRDRWLLQRDLASEESAAEEIEWSFGQTLPVIMLLAPLIQVIGAFAGAPNTSPPPRISTNGEEQNRNRLAYQACATTSDSAMSLIGPGSNNPQGDLTIDASLQLDGVSEDGEAPWLRRNYYEAKWAPPLSFFACLQMFAAGFFLFLDPDGEPMIIQLWPWVCFAQPVAIYLTILAHIAGENFKGARRCLGHLAGRYGLPVVLCGGFALAFWLTQDDMYPMYWDGQVVGIGPTFASIFGTCGGSLLIYSALMFFMAK